MNIDDIGESACGVAIYAPVRPHDPQYNIRAAGEILGGNWNEEKERGDRRHRRYRGGADW